MRRRRWKWKEFHKMASWNISNTFRIAGKVYSCTMGLFWMNFKLNDCAVLQFSEIRWFLEYLAATTPVPILCLMLYSAYDLSFPFFFCVENNILQNRFLEVLRNSNTPIFCQKHHKATGSVIFNYPLFNLLTPNVNYSGRTAPLTTKVAF